MQKEYDALINHATCKLVDPPFGTKIIGCKWVFKNKYKAYGSLDKHKVMLVEKAFAQKEGVSYDCELNFSIDFETNSFNEATYHDEWKEAMQK